MKSRFYLSNPSIHPYLLCIHSSITYPSTYPPMSTIYASSITTIYVAICTINPSSINIPGCIIIYHFYQPTHQSCIYPSIHPCLLSMHHLSLLSVYLPIYLYHLSISIIYPSSIHTNNQSTIYQAI